MLCVVAPVLHKYFALATLLCVNEVVPPSQILAEAGRVPAGFAFTITLNVSYTWQLPESVRCSMYLFVPVAELESINESLDDSNGPPTNLHAFCIIFLPPLIV